MCRLLTEIMCEPEGLPRSPLPGVPLPPPTLARSMSTAGEEVGVRRADNAVVLMAGAALQEAIRHIRCGGGDEQPRDVIAACNLQLTIEV